MHNWWIATLEHMGLITQEEAQHVANEIKFTTHPEVYNDAYREIEAILRDNKVNIEDRLKHTSNYISRFTKLEDRVRQLEQELEGKKTVASKIKA